MNSAGVWILRKAGQGKPFGKTPEAGNDNLLPASSLSKLGHDLPEQLAIAVPAHPIGRRQGRRRQLALAPAVVTLIHRHIVPAQSYDNSFHCSLQ